jgi:hypothetical protein
MVHSEKMGFITNAAFRLKVSESALLYARNILVNKPENTPDAVKMFSQIVLREITMASPPWLDGLCYFTLSVTPGLTLAQATAATQDAVTTEVNIAYPYYAKAHYGDIS